MTGEPSAPPHPQLDLVAPLFAPPEGRTPRSAGYGWACPCHGGPVLEWRCDEGWVTTSPADTCPRRGAVTPATEVRRRDADAFKARVPLTAMAAPPAGLALPPDIHRLIPRLLKVGVAPGRHGWLTYSLHWWSTAVKLDALDAPPDADRPSIEEGSDERDEHELIELPTGELVKRKGRSTYDVAVLRESLALRAWPVGVVLWLRELNKGETWKPGGGFVRGEDGRPIAAGVLAFKQALKELEK